MKYIPVVIVFGFIFFACSIKSSSQNISTSNTKINWEKFSFGADLSFVNEIEDYNGKYYDSGKQKDPFKIFSDYGANTIRVRLWNNPDWFKRLTGGKLYSELSDLEKTIRRAKENGMAVNLDLHYSDNWADPQKQVTPAAWQGLSLAVLKDSVYNYTLRVLNYLKSKNLTPEMIQVGNETNFGMLWPLGKVENNNYSAFAELLKSGIKAVRDFSAGSIIKPQIILHEAQLQTALDWAEAVISKNGVTDFDIIGLSHYSKWSTVNKMDSISLIISRLKKTYNKKVMIVEAAYPWTTDYADNYNNFINAEAEVAGYPISKEGQLKYMTDLTQAIINGGGCGIQYWEPAWITSSMPDQWGKGSSYENCTLFDFSGNVLPGMYYMRHVYKF
ncbi:MAG: arabinogalactan endo-1,4-beta-galactosidase [Sphingobacteriales bacterium]|nr:MAG: arabinogalactan endo-1,4-beta-galactosidase [Sphingobacteriales bacterium]